MVEHMEHRCERRIPVALQVELQDREQSLGRFETRDVGLEGAFVETGPIEVEPYEVVTLVLRLGRGRRWTYELPGLVVHRSSEGIGLMYAAEDPDLQRTLRSILDTAA